jgi:hypothetical protein
VRVRQDTFYIKYLKENLDIFGYVYKASVSGKTFGTTFSQYLTAELPAVKTIFLLTFSPTRI